MIVYIATRFDWHQPAALARHLLTEAGHVCTSRWIDEAARLDGVCAAVPIGDPRRAANAEMDLEDLEAADAILVLVPPQGGTGMWLELGVAVGRMRRGEMRCLMVGPAQERTIFAELLGVEVFGRPNEAVEALRGPVEERCPECGDEAILTNLDGERALCRDCGLESISRLVTVKGIDACAASIEAARRDGRGVTVSGSFGPAAEMAARALAKQEVDLCGAELIAAERRLVPVDAQCGLPMGHDGPCKVRR